MKRRIVTLIAITIILITVLAGSGCFESEPTTKELGDYAKGFLQDKKYKRLVIEIDYVEGFPPTQEVLDLLQSRINFYCDKDQTLIFKDSIPKPSSSYSLDDIKKLEDKNRDYHKSKSDIVAYILYLNGAYSDNNDVLGVAYSPSSIAIFKEKIYDISIPFWATNLVDSVDYEKSVVIHEFGHLLAMVNIGYQSDRNHEDTQGSHCIDDNCVMYRSVETVSIGSLITQEDPQPPTDFDADCRSDMANLKSDVF
jgi:hypothetical protein